MFLRPILMPLMFLSLSAWADPGVVVLAGGDSEGDIGVKTEWSYPLYKRLVDNGDTNGDKKLKVVVLSIIAPSSNFMVDYFKDLGADSSENLIVETRAAAEDPKVVEMLKDADVVFMRGGNQGLAYQNWKDTKLHEELKKLADRGGAFGGTSSGAMGLSQYSITGNQDFDSREVLIDSHSPLLNDEKNVMSSGIHDDFLNVAPGIVVDTHCGERARVGRLMSTLAKTIDDYKDNKIVAVCLEERTGIAIEKGRARIYGTGGAHFLSETPETKKIREPGKPLSYTNVRNDVLTDGWTYSFATRSPDLDSKPKDTKELMPAIDCASVSKHFSFKSRDIMDLPKVKASEPLLTKGITVFEESYSDLLLLNGDLKKGIIQTHAFEKIAADPSRSVFLLDGTNELKGIKENKVSVSAKDQHTVAPPTLILDCKNCTHTSKSPYVAFLDSGSKTLRTSAIVNLRVHALRPGDTYDVKSHKVSLKEAEENCDPGVPKLENIEELISSETRILQALKCSEN